METIHITYYQSPVGEMMLGVHQDHLVMADWRYRKMRQAIDSRIKNYTKSSIIESKHSLHHATIEQLEEYFTKKRTTFDLPIAFLGTPFQIGVWKQLLKIPYASQMSYSQFASSLDHPKAVRAIGTAIGANALSIIVPCHRVVGQNGDLVGYAGGLSAKKSLLQLESQSILL
jgi:methylated-DNA-[protein]-cysteine S-methyltransferase